MPIQQVCTVASMTQLDANTWWMVLEVGKLVEQQPGCIPQPEKGLLPTAKVPAVVHDF